MKFERMNLNALNKLLISIVLLQLPKMLIKVAKLLFLTLIVVFPTEKVVYFVVLV